MNLYDLFQVHLQYPGDQDTPVLPGQHKAIVRSDTFLDAL